MLLSLTHIIAIQGCTLGMQPMKAIVQVSLSAQSMYFRHALGTANTMSATTLAPELEVQLA